MGCITVCVSSGSGSVIQDYSLIPITPKEPTRRFKANLLAVKPVIGYASARRGTERGTKGRKKSTFCPAEPPVQSALDLFALSRNFQDFVTVYPLLLSVFVENLFNCHLCIFYDDYCTLSDILNLGIKYFKISVFFLPTLFAHNTFRKFKPACKM